MSRGINERLDKVPTNDLLLAYLSKTDAEVAGLKEDVEKVENGLADDIAEIKEDLSGFKKKIEEARRWGIGASMSAGGLLIAAIGLAKNMTG